MAMKAAFADRNRYMADPYFNEVPVEWMIDKDRAAYWTDHIESGKPIDVTFDVTEPPHTTHVTVVDALGNCVALTHSLGASSGVITPSPLSSQRALTPHAAAIVAVRLEPCPFDSRSPMEDCFNPAFAASSS